MNDVSREEFESLRRRVEALERGKLLQDFALAALRWGVPITLTLVGIVAMIWIGSR